MKKQNWGYKTYVGYIFAATRHLEAAINLLQLDPKNCYNLPRGHDDFIWHPAKRSPKFLRETEYQSSTTFALYFNPHQLNIS